MGQQLSETLPDGETESWTYDSFGRMATFTDFDGNLATYTYDDSSHLVNNQNDGHTGDGVLSQVVYTGPGKPTQTVNYVYDALGRQESVTDDSGTTTYSYNAQSDLTQEQTPEGTINYVYDPATGNHVGTYTADTDTVYSYDALGRLTQVSQTELNGQTLSTPLNTTYAYDADGNLAHESLPNGVGTRYTYDTLNRLLTETQKNSSGTTIFSESFTLNPDGTRATATEIQLQPDGSTATNTSTWTYDALDRLMGESVTSSF